jgi:hypothetical protein
VSLIHTNLSKKKKKKTKKKNKKSSATDLFHPGSTGGNSDANRAKEQLSEEIFVSTAFTLRIAPINTNFRSSYFGDKQVCSIVHELSH